MHSISTKSLGRYILQSLCGIGLVLSVTTARADIIFDDGLTHELTGVHFDNVILSNRSNLNLGQGAFLHSATAGPAIRSEYLGATVNLAGNATVIGGIDFQGWGSGGGTTVATGNSLVIGSLGGGTAVAGMDQVDLNSDARLIGGYGDTQGGIAVENSTSGGIYINIAGGLANGGYGGHTGGAGLGLQGANEAFHMNMTSGAIRGGDGG
ncbi:MAG: hypothetical protein RIA65_10460, partial [Woeseia sp.]